MIRRCIGIVAVLLCFATPSAAASICDADEVQSSGSKYRICMPPAGQYNGILVVWAHGFQDAGTAVQIPEDQLCQADFCIHRLVNDLGFAFATNSYSKTGLAILQGKEDLVDLVRIFAAEKGEPRKVYLIGASEGGIITALSLEQHSDVYSAGVAACGPVGNFPYQINYFGGARATFEYFFPGLIPGDPFNPPPTLAAGWADYYEQVVKPVIFAPAKRRALEQWVAVAQLPFDESNYLPSLEISVRDVLRYSVVNLTDAAATLGGFPFDNRWHWYTGSDDDFSLNWFVPRVSADAAAVTEMNTQYATTGKLARPLITLHTLRDQQVPYAHEPLYALKTLSTGAFLTRHLNIPVDRFGHCNFTQGEALISFAIMLFYDGILGEVTGTAAALSGTELTNFERRAAEIGLRTRRSGSHLAFKLKQ
jgi:pimeloyl-ACP methyl ester carboxylesterase